MRSGSPVIRAMHSAVCTARAASLLTSTSGRSAATSGDDLVRLSAADVVERRIGLALEAALGVPLGPAVPEQDEAHGYSSSKGRKGQSFQSRSRA